MRGWELSSGERKSGSERKGCSTRKALVHLEISTRDDGVRRAVRDIVLFISYLLYSLYRRFLLRLTHLKLKTKTSTFHYKPRRSAH